MSKPLDEAWAWLKGQLGDKAAMLIAGASFLGIGMAYAHNLVRDTAREETEPLRIEQARMRALQERYEDDVHEFGKDLRELYRVTPWVRQSPRLEAPFPAHDGGTP